MRDKEKQRQCRTRYRERHREEINRNARGTRKDYQKTYYLKNRDKYLERVRVWAANNKEKTREYKKRYKQKIRARLKRQHMRTRIERVVAQFVEYCKDRYDAETVIHYTRNINRFLDYVRNHSTHCKEYHKKMYHELKKPQEERDLGWTKEFQRLRHIEDIDRDYITKYVAFVNHDEMSVHTKLPLNQSEKETRLYPFKAFLKFCAKKGYLKQDMRRFIYVPGRERKVLKRLMTVDEMGTLLDAPDVSTAAGIRNKALLELSYSGLRAEEMLTLKVEHVDTVANSVTIYDGKGSKDRVVPMTNEAIYWIKRWLPRRGAYLGDGEDPGYLFATKSKKHMHTRAFRRLVKFYVKKAKIDLDVSPHDLRRITATHLVENGAPIRQIQALLGHVSLKVTTKYLRLSDEKIKAEHRKSHPANRRELHYGQVQE